jgi:hypothetical protein
MFRGMSEERVTLEFLGKQLDGVIAEQNSTRDDLRVLTTIVLRLEGTLNGVLNQLHAMISQHQRINASTPDYVGSKKSERLERVGFKGIAAESAQPSPIFSAAIKTDCAENLL